MANGTRVKIITGVVILLAAAFAPELKEIATDIIPCNNEDGVAKWLLAHCLNQR